MQITGTVSYISLSGGFWGIIGDDGNKYNPLSGLPRNLQQEGIKVKASCKPSNDFSIHMWGKNVDLTNVEKI
ncbi:MAG: hypothetical protein AAF696_11205 [Bacteroidota bacterium]